MTKDQIRAIFLGAGFTIKEGQTDLRPYVYDAAYCLLSASIADTAGAKPIYQERATLLSSTWFDVSITEYRERLDTDGPEWVRIVHVAAPPAPSSDTAGAKPVAWRWRLTAEINGKQWGPGPWEYTTHPEKFESRTLYEVEPLYTHPSAEIAALRERIAGMEKDAEIGHALIANGLYDRMNDMVDADEPRRLIEELIATVDPILYAKWAGRDARSSAEIAALRERITDLEAVEAMRDEEIAGLREKHGNALERIAGMEKDAKPCTCHPDDNPPIPCAKQYALSECRSVADGENK